MKKIKSPFVLRPSTLLRMHGASRRTNQIKQITKLLFLISFISFSFLNGADKIIQPGTANGNFAQNIIAKAYDRYTGTFYVATGANNGDHTIAKANRDTVPTTGFTGIARGEAQAAVTSPNIALMNNAGTEATHLAFKGDGGTATDLKVIRLTVADYTITFTVPHGTAATGTNVYCLANGNDATNFTRIAGGYHATSRRGYIFIRVRPGTDGAEHSGILAFRINDTGDKLQRVGVGATNNAVKLDDRRGDGTPGEGGPGGGIGNGNFLRYGSSSPQLNTRPVVTDMHWDPQLETLFICGNVTSHRPGWTAGGDNIISAITKVKFTDTGNLHISDILPTNANPAQNNTSTIFTSKSQWGGALAPPPISSRIFKIRTMHTSTNRTYLIVNGDIDIGNTEEVQNRFYALQYDKTKELSGTLNNPWQLGTIVANDNAKTALRNNFKRTENAADLDGRNPDSLVVGGELAPWIAEYKVADMEVVGDTVYVSFAARTRGAHNDPGVWATSAMFDNDGVIIGWTKWERVFPSQNDNNEDRASFIAVDAKTGQLWQVNRDGTDARVVRRTNIKTTNFAPNSLQAQLNRDLSDGCTCVLDLPQNTHAIGQGDFGDHGATISNSFVLFGGIQKVAFARTKYGNARAVTENFGATPHINYALTNLPTAAGTVRCLGFSRYVLVDRTSHGYFFAGTDTGLYVYAQSADPHAGFNTEENAGLISLRNAPFDDNSEWLPMAADNITDPVTAIDSNGTYLFVVEQGTTSFTSKLWRIELQDNINAMNPVQITESGDATNMPANTIFTGLKLVSSNTGEHQRGIISTNLGIFRSNAQLSHFNPARDKWQQIDTTNVYHSIYAPKRTPKTLVYTNFDRHDGAQHKVWAIALADSNKGLNLYQNSKFYQFNTNAGLIQTTPLADANYTNANLKTGTSALKYLDRSIYFWSDGARRFYTRFNANESVYNSIYSLPYFGAPWAITEPYKFKDLSSIKRIYWIENISGLGIVVAGTDTGVISLVE
jgi:hypothetical protein